MNQRSKFAAFLIVCFLLGFVGCSGDESDESTEVNGPPPGADDHGHSGEGPNGGLVIELGHDHSLHAELASDSDAKSVTVYILSGELESKAVAAGSLTLNLKQGDEPTSYELSAVEESAEGSSSFSSTDEALYEAFSGHKFSEGQVSIEVDGTAFVGSFKHADFH